MATKKKPKKQKKKLTALEEINAKIEELKADNVAKQAEIKAAKVLNELTKKNNQYISALKRLAACEAPEVDWMEVYNTQSHRFNKGGTPLEILHLLIAGKIETDDENCLTPSHVRDQLIALGYNKYAAFVNNKGYMYVYNALRKIGEMAGMEWMGKVRVGIYV
jgi:hypothetical protein|tara:strand:+ start:2082 stop:2570 length:489 start_codon:yes stop_codon:yes gene_type:complete